MLFVTSAARKVTSMAHVGHVGDILLGSKLRCAVVTAHVQGLGEVSAFPDSGLNVTIIATHLPTNLKV